MCIVYISDLQLPNTDMYISTIRPTDNMEQNVGKLFLPCLCACMCVLTEADSFSCRIL